MVESPKTMSELLEEHDGVHDRTGLPMKNTKQYVEEIENALKGGETQGIIRIVGERGNHPVYTISDEHMPYAKYMLQKVEGYAKFIHKLPTSKNAVISSFFVHLVLGSLKILIGILSGSIALLADGVDSAVDALSAVIVGITNKMQREALGALILLILMVLSGFTILYQSILKLLKPEELEETILAGIIAIFAILLCLLLYYFQQYVGSREQNMAILTQAQDSRNHILIGIMVLVSVVTNWFNWFFVDGLVGLLIGILILLATIELGSDLIKQSAGEEIDWERYSLGGIAGTYNKLRIKQTEYWLLETCLLRPIKEDELNESYIRKFSTEIPFLLTTLGIGPDKNLGKRFSDGLTRLLEKKFLLDKPDGITITENGENHLNVYLTKSRKRRKSIKWFGNLIFQV
ncbi:MAG: cation diffusion facilitator family transporter [Candidatus Kariarchaeaceae archaeon]